MPSGKRVWHGQQFGLAGADDFRLSGRTTVLREETATTS